MRKIDNDPEVLSKRKMEGRVPYWLSEDIEVIVMDRQIKKVEEKNKPLNVFDVMGDFKNVLRYFIRHDYKENSLLYRKNKDLNEWGVASPNFLNDLEDSGLYEELSDIYATMVDEGKTTFLISKSEKDGYFVFPLHQKWEKLTNQIKSDPHFITGKVEQFTNDPDVMCYKFFDLNKVEDGDYTHWKIWETQFLPDDLEVYKAWIYSIFVADNKSRQMLWLYDPGSSGKSMTIETIGHYGGDHFACPVKLSQIADKFYGTFFDKYRLVYFDDVESSIAMSVPSIKTVSSGNDIMVDRKSNPVPYRASTMCKIAFTANMPPVITGDIAGESRAIVIRIQPATTENRQYMLDMAKSNLEKILTSELPSFLYSCRESYLQLCPGGGDIILNDRQQQVVKECVADEATIVKLFVKSFFEYGEEVKKKVVMMCKEHFEAVSGSKIDFGHFLNIIKMKGVSTDEYNDNGVLLQKYVGLSLNKNRCKYIDGRIEMIKQIGGDIYEGDFD
jgi:hypothetical protein